MGRELSGDYRLLTPTEASERLGVPVGTLCVWRCTKAVPIPYVKLGRSVRYRAEDLDRFVAENTIKAGAGR